MRTLVDILRDRGQQEPDRLAFRFLADGERESATLTYAGLDRKARAIARELSSLNVFGKPVLMVYSAGLEFVAAYIGCLYSGAVAVPVPAPHRSRLDRNAARVIEVARDSGAVAAMTTAALRDSVMRLFEGLADAPRCFASDAIPASHGDHWTGPEISGSMLAFLQYTSGSTTQPRGVMVSHDNLIHNLSFIRERFGHSGESQGVVWLPPFHDMELIGGILQPAFAGFPVTLMPPVAFLQRPIRWLQAISRFRGTTSGGPNFAYDLCIRKIAPERVAGLDLSSWEVAFNGAEQIQPDTIERFAEYFAPCGFRRHATYACYGLAENALMATGGRKLTAPVLRKFSSAALQQNRVVAEGEQTIVGCGQASEEQRVVIADPEQCTRCAPDEVGEIWLSGPSVAQGYWNRPSETEATFGAHLAGTGEGPFLRTGDLGFVKDGDLFVTGRLKDLIIMNGANHYPRDIELTVERAIDSVAESGVAAFSVDVDGREQLIILAEMRSGYMAALKKSGPPDFGEPAFRKLTADVRRVVSEVHDLPVSDFVPLEAGTIPRTSSAKIQRYACRRMYLAWDGEHRWERAKTGSTALREPVQ